MACKPADFQPDGAVRGEPQRDRAGVLLDHGQQLEHAVGLAERDAVMVDGRHLVENKGGMGAAQPVGRGIGLRTTICDHRPGIIRRGWCSDIQCKSEW